MFLSELRQQLLSSKQRVLLHLQGERTWAYQWLRSQLSQLPDLDTLWFGAAQSQPIEVKQLLELRLKQYKKYLGQEKDLVVLDAYSGFNPDAFGALAGIVKLGGIFILITPEDLLWSEHPDPELTRLCTEPFQITDIEQSYVKRLIRLLNNSDDIVKVTQKQQSAPKLTPRAAKDLTDEQAQVTQWLTKTLQDKQKTSFAAILQADRGRGKSSLLGLVGANILSTAKKGNTKIIVTAPLSDSIQTLFLHCQRALLKLGYESQIQNNELVIANGSLQFAPPDKLMLELPKADVLLVDEAAAIPIQMLKPIVSEYDKAVFATTVHGYEGTGRGFEYKLKPLIAQQYEHLSDLRLSQPIRWYADDLLERKVNQLLALDADLEEVRDVSAQKLEFKIWSSKQLLDNEQKLMQIFALLIHAHYRTSPSDLRQLLDGPNISIVTLEAEQKTIAAALIAREGTLPDPLAQAVWQGRRRPRGHLFPQSLLAHSGFEQAGSYSYNRVVRIAVHPQIQRSGIGARLIAEIESWSQNNGIDFLCTSYGFDTGLYRFWQQVGMQPARLGLKQEASTGEFSVLMFKPLKPSHNRFFQQVTERFGQTFSAEQKLNLRGEIPGMSARELSYALEEQDLRDLQAFSYHFRGLNTCVLAMLRFVYTTKESTKKVIPKLILDKCSGQYSDKQLIEKYKLTGDKALVSKLRELWQTILEQNSGHH